MKIPGNALLARTSLKDPSKNVDRLFAVLISDLRIRSTSKASNSRNQSIGIYGW
jgi:hypothetical protein